MLLKKVYDSETLTERAWYDSSMFYYTKFTEHTDENRGELFVTFKNGATYHYINVDFNDYLVLIAGGTDASQGKTLNKVIKGKYDFERVADENIGLLEEEYQNIVKTAEKKDNEKEETCFISGHRDLTEEEFENNYKPAILDFLNNHTEGKFVIGDYEGADIMAQNYLLNSLAVIPERVTVYHIGDVPQNKNEKVTILKGGFANDEERDAAMTAASFRDIAFVRDWTKLSGTAQNILRRQRLF